MKSAEDHTAVRANERARPFRLRRSRSSGVILSPLPNAAAKRLPSGATLKNEKGTRTGAKSDGRPLSQTHISPTSGGTT